jgi:hypothetical protein
MTHPASLYATLAGKVAAYLVQQTQPEKPPPPAEKATRCQYEAGQASTSNWAGNGCWNRCCWAIETDEVETPCVIARSEIVKLLNAAVSVNPKYSAPPFTVAGTWSTTELPSLNVNR